MKYNNQLVNKYRITQNLYILLIRAKHAISEDLFCLVLNIIKAWKDY